MELRTGPVYNTAQGHSISYSRAQHRQGEIREMVSHTEAQHGTGKDTGTCIRVAVCHTAPPGSSRAAHLPPIEVQGCELPKVGIAHVHVE